MTTTIPTCRSRDKPRGIDWRTIRAMVQLAGRPMGGFGWYLLAMQLAGLLAIAFDVSAAHALNVLVFQFLLLLGLLAQVLGATLTLAVSGCRLALPRIEQQWMILWHLCRTLLPIALLYIDSWIRLTSIFGLSLDRRLWIPIGIGMCSALLALLIGQELDYQPLLLLLLLFLSFTAIQTSGIQNSLVHIVKASSERRRLRTLPGLPSVREQQSFLHRRYVEVAALNWLACLLSAGLISLALDIWFIVHSVLPLTILGLWLILRLDRQMQELSDHPGNVPQASPQLLLLMGLMLLLWLITVWLGIDLWVTGMVLLGTIVYLQWWRNGQTRGYSLSWPPDAHRVH